MRGIVRDGEARLWIALGFVGAFALIGCASKESPREAPAARIFVVSPSGDDAAAGTEEAPFATIQHAIDAARNTKPGTPRTICLRGGTYYLDKPVEVTPPDSGTVEAPLMIEPYPNEKPVLSGGREVKDWKAEQFNGKACWVAEIPEAGRAGASPA